MQADAWQKDFAADVQRSRYLYRISRDTSFCWIGQVSIIDGQRVGVRISDSQDGRRGHRQHVSLYALVVQTAAAGGIDAVRTNRRIPHTAIIHLSKRQVKLSNERQLYAAKQDNHCDDRDKREFNHRLSPSRLTH